VSVSLSYGVERELIIEPSYLDFDEDSIYFVLSSLKKHKIIYVQTHFQEGACMKKNTTEIPAWNGAKE